MSRFHNLLSLGVFISVTLTGCAPSPESLDTQTSIAATETAAAWTATPSFTPSPTSTPQPTPIGGANWLVFDTWKIRADRRCGPFEAYYLHKCDNNHRHSSMGIYLIRTDGTGQKQIAGPDHFLVDVSSDGQKILAIKGHKFDPGLHLELYVLDIDGSRPLLLSDQIPADISAPAFFLSDGKQIAFIATENGEDHIFLIKSDGSGLQRVTAEGSEPWPLGLVKSNDDTKIYWDRRDGSPYSPYTDYYWSINVDGTNRQQINTEKFILPAFSPAGTYMAYLSAGSYDLIVSKSDGSQSVEDFTNFTNRLVSNYSWSPDGTMLLVSTFDSDKFLWSPTTRETMPLPKNINGKFYFWGGEALMLASPMPSWSPDQQQLVTFILYDYNNVGINLLNITTFETTPLPIDLADGVIVGAIVFVP